MKRIVGFSMLSIFVFSFVFVSCAKDCHQDVVGKWTLNQKLRTDFFDEEDEGKKESLGYVLINQTVTYSFDENLLYERTVEEEVEDCVFEETNEQFAQMLAYKGAKTAFTVRGKYKASDKKLFLNASSIEFSGGEPIDYAEYRKTSPDMDVQNSVQDYRRDGDDLIIFRLATGQDEKYSPVK